MQALDCRKIQTGELFILYIRVKTDPRDGPASGPRGFLSQFCGLRTALGPAASSSTLVPPRARLVPKSKVLSDITYLICCPQLKM